MPGVSRNTAWAPGRVRMPTTRVRVVCGFGVTIATFSPTSAFVSVDLPTFGRPTMATYAGPMRCGDLGHHDTASGRSRDRASSACIAAACSAGFLLRPSPRPQARPSMLSSEMNRLS